MKTDRMWSPTIAHGVVKLVPERLAEPLRWRKPANAFVDSRSDLFHASLTNEEIAAVYGVMAACPQHAFQVLTKRPERMLEWYAWLERATEQVRAVFPDDPPEWRRGHIVRAAALRAGCDRLGRVVETWPLPNVWPGVSAEDQATANERISILLQVPSAVRQMPEEIRP